MVRWIAALARSRCGTGAAVCGFAREGRHRRRRSTKTLFLMRQILALLAERKGDLDRDARGDRLPQAKARAEPPLPNGDHRLLIEAAIERTCDAHAGGIDSAVGAHDDFHDHHTLD